MAGGRSAVVVANELLDNLPAALAVRSGDGWEERHVGLVDGALALVAAHPRPEVVTWADRFAGPVPERGIVEVQLEASRWVTGVLRRLRRGALVAFDYGDTAAELAPRRAEGTVRTYRGHHLGPDPLLEPGATDITMDVNFTAAVAAAERAHARVELVSQAEFLGRWGLGGEIDRLVSEERELAGGGDPMRRLQVRSEHTDAATLLHPRGLGDFRVLGGPPENVNRRLRSLPARGGPGAGSAAAVVGGANRRRGPAIRCGRCGVDRDHGTAQQAVRADVGDDSEVGGVRGEVDP